MATTTLYPLATVAKVVNLSERRVQQLVKEGILPKPEKRKYDLIACVMAYIKYLQERAFGKDAAPQDTHLERARLLKAQADKTELEVGTLRHELLLADDVLREWQNLLSACRSKLLSVPTKCAAQIVSLDTPGDVERFLKRTIHEALTELSRYEPETIPDSHPSGEDTDPTTGTDGESVGGSVSETESGGE